MIRSQWKLSSSDVCLKNVNNIRSKSLKISEKFVNSIVYIYNGHRLIPIEIVKEKIGLRLGELILTKKLGKAIHAENKLQVKKRKKLVLMRQRKKKIVRKRTN
jgi:ribosomal protein S19